MSRTQRSALAWAVVILGLHLIPRAGIAGAPGGPQFLASNWQDKAGHAALFAVLGLLWFRDPEARWLPLATVGVAFGALLELIQAGAPLGRTGSLEDLVSDAIGLGLGMLLGLWLRPARLAVAEPA